MVQAVGEAIEVREEVGTAGDLSVDAFERPLELVLIQRSTPVEGKYQVLDQASGLLYNRENVPDFVSGSGGDLGYESSCSVLGRSHLDKMSETGLGRNKPLGARPKRRRAPLRSALRIPRDRKNGFPVRIVPARIRRQPWIERSSGSPGGRPDAVVGTPAS